MTPRSIEDSPGPLPGERAPKAQSAWKARIARVGDSLGMPLDPGAIEEEPALNVGPLRARPALRLAMEGRLEVIGKYKLGDGRTEYHVSVADADDGECVRGTVVL